MNVLVVGGAGYLGGAVTDLLPDAWVYDSLLYEESYRKNVTFTFGDIRDKNLLKRHLKWADAVVWLAAIVGDGACALNPSLSTEINQESVKWLADNFDGRIVFMSTCSVYGAQNGLLTEDSPTNPLSVYASTKLKAEEYLKDKNAIVFRLGTLFGVGDAYSRIRTDLVVNTMVARAIYEGKLKVFGGEQYRPLLHVRDAAKAIIDNLTTSHTGVFNLHKENMKMSDLAYLVAKRVPCEIETVESTFEDARNYRVNSDKAKQIGFKAEYSVERGITQVGALLGGGRIKDINNPRYSNQGFLMEVRHGH